MTFINLQKPAYWIALGKIDHEFRVAKREGKSKVKSVKMWTENCVEWLMAIRVGGLRSFEKENAGKMPALRF